MDFSAGKSCGFGMTTCKFTLVLKQQVAHTGTGATTMISRGGGTRGRVARGVMLALRFHAWILLVVYQGCDVVEDAVADAARL